MKSLINNKYKIILLIISIMLLSFMAVTLNIARIDKPANASSEIYEIQNWQKKESDKSYFNSEEGCTYIVSMEEYSNEPLVENIYYSAYQVSMSTEDIDRDEEDNILNPFVKDEEDEDINRVKVPEDEIERTEWGANSRRTLSFEITAHEWSAFQFYVQWEQDEEILEQESDFFYCTNIDNSPPWINLTSEPVFQDNGYLFDYRIRANALKDDRTANSGFKKVRTYRIIDGEEETIDEYTSFDNHLVFYGEILAVKGEYYIEAYDGVGNRSNGRVTTIDYDINESITIANVEEIIQKKEDYAKEIYDNLYNKYVEWQLMKLDSEASESELQDAYQEVMDALSKVTLAEKQFNIKTINSDYIKGEISIDSLNAETFPYTVFGEKVTMYISFALFDTGTVNKDTILQKAKMQQAKEILALNIETTSNLQELQVKDFESPLKITIPMDEYEDAKAISVTETSETTEYNELRVDKGEDWITVYVPTSETVVNIVIDDGSSKSNLKWLYLLFLILPITGGIMLFIYRDKIFKNKKKQKIRKVSS